MATAFDADLGTYQGRIQKAGAPEGEYVYELGHALPNVVRWFIDGDKHVTAQTGDLSGKTLMGVTVDVRPPAEVPLGMTWTFTWSVGGTQVYSTLIEPGRTRRRRDITLNLVPVAGGGDQEVLFQLAVSGTPGDTYEAEIPSVQVDALVRDDSTTPRVVTRDPEPDDVDVPVGTTIAFWITDPSGGGIDSGSVDVYVNGEFVVAGGVVQGGWGMVWTSPDAYTESYVLTPPADFASSQVVTVQATARSADNSLIDSTWSFTCEDLLAPALVSVIGFSRTVVRVELDEPVVADDPAGTYDALNPANYALSLHAGAPAIVPTVVSVEADGNVLLLQLDEEMTPYFPGPPPSGPTYLLTITNVSDLDGNVVAAPGLPGLFTGYACPPVPGRIRNWVTLYQRMPARERYRDIHGTQDLWKFLSCLQEPIDQMLCDVDEWPNVLDVDLAPEPFVDAMLADLGNPFEEFSSSFTLNEKRKLVKVLVPMFKQKGTDQGMINAIRLILGLEVTISVPAIEDIWEVGVSELGVDTYLGTSDIGSLYDFYVVSPIALTEQQRTDIRKIVAFMRRAPTHLAGIIEPDPPPIVPDDWELGLSELGVGTLLH